MTVHPSSFLLHPFSRYRPIIDDWDAFQAAIVRPLPTSIWTNTLKTTPEQLAESLTADNLPLQPIPWYPGGFRLPPAISPGRRWQYLAGLYHVQEEVSMLPVLCLDPQPGERILDMCAAPGNKTAQIGVALNNGGTVVANDRNAGRMRACRQTLNRLGLVNVATTTYDGANYPREAGLFDKVLVDAPCSCEGTSRKDATILKRASAQTLRGKPSVQKAILRKAAQLCRPGGRIVYATCTYAPEENEMVVDAILREAGPELRLLPARIEGFTTSAGVTAWNGERLHDSLRLAMRVWPHQNDTGGFFVAVMEKMGSGQCSVVGDQCSVVSEREPWLGMLADRFGMGAGRFDPYTIFRWSRRGIYITNQEQQSPAQPKPDAIGMFFMRTEGKYPKLSTAAAMTFGSWARRNMIDLTQEQVDAYIGRRDFYIPAGQAQRCTGTGYVLVRRQGIVLGVAVFRPDESGESGLVESLFPKAWSRQALRNIVPAKREF